MKKLVCLISILCVLVLEALSVSAAPTFTTEEYEGVAYIDVTNKEDLDALVMEAWKNHEEHTNICYTVEGLSWDEWDYVDITTYSQYNTKGYFTFLEYSANCIYTTCVQQYLGSMQFTEKAYGTLDIEFLDNREETAKADALIQKVLKKIETYSLYDKLLYIADYVCAATQYGSQELPGGGYDAINGAYDVLTGVRTNTVCTSYALTFQRFMEMLGMDSYLMSNVYHAWNVVKIDGKWYGIDCTADTGNEIDRPHFLMGLSTMKRNYATDRLDPFGIFAKKHTFSGEDYGNTPVKTTTKKATTTTVAVTTAKPTAVATTTTNSTTTTAITVVTTEPTTTTTTTSTTATETTGSTTLQTTSTSSVVTDTVTATRPTVIVDLNESSTVDETVFQEAAQKGSVLELKSETYSWVFNGDELTQNATALDATIHVDEQVAMQDREQIETVAETADIVPFTFAHHGDLPAKAQISLQLNDVYAGKHVGVYYVNEEGAPVLQENAKVSANGVLTFTTDHCSLWFLKPVKNTVPWWIFLLAGSAIVSVVTAVVILTVRKKAK